LPNKPTGKGISSVQLLRYAFVLNLDVMKALFTYLGLKVNGPISRIWGVVWIAIVGEIWKHQNKCVFNNGKVDHQRCLRWLKGKPRLG